MEPMSLILGLPSNYAKTAAGKRLNNILIFAARKNILLHWVNDTIPFVCCWCKIILKLIPQEYLTNINHDNADQFYGVWSLFLDYIEPDRSSTLLKVLLCT